VPPDEPGTAFSGAWELPESDAMIMGSESVLLGTLAAASSAKAAAFWSAYLFRKWRATADEDGHYSFAVEL
jgi:hypothetical protein